MEVVENLFSLRSEQNTVDGFVLVLYTSEVAKLSIILQIFLKGTVQLRPVCTVFQGWIIPLSFEMTPTYRKGQKRT
jgi:hypothetical protein